MSGLLTSGQVGMQAKELTFGGAVSAKLTRRCSNVPPGGERQRCTGAVFGRLQSSLAAFHVGPSWWLQPAELRRRRVGAPGTVYMRKISAFPERKGIGHALEYSKWMYYT